MVCLTARLDIPDQLKAQASYALRELCHRVGFGVRIDASGPADIVYSVTSRSQTGIELHCNPRVYLPGTLCCLQSRNGVQIWEQSDLAFTQPLDLIGGTYRLLTMMDEAHVSVQARDRLGRFSVGALPDDRRATAAVPMVELHAEALRELIRKRRPTLLEQAACRWPEGREYALVMTHDCDHVHVGAAMEIAANLAKAALRRSRLHAELAAVGAQYVSRGLQNPFFRFKEWQQWESGLRLRSVFYVPVRPRGVAFDLNDCKSTIEASIANWDQLRMMAADGWEFGLHATIRTRERPWAFQAAREWLEQHIEQPVRGVRHHYFALDWPAPHKTHCLHAKAGFEYDSSIAFHDAPGFRSGTCLPYIAFDPVNNRELSLSVLPCSLMDGHILSDANALNGGGERAIERAREVIDTVRRCGGLLVLNWHQETAFNRLEYAGWIDVLHEIMAMCLRHSPWTATAREVCSYWKRRSLALDESPVFIADAGIRCGDRCSWGTA